MAGATSSGRHYRIGGCFFDIVEPHRYRGFGTANPPIRLAAQARPARHPAIPRR